MAIDVQKVLEDTVAEVQLQLDVVYQEAERQETSPFHMKTADGKFVLVPLITAKAQAASALAMLKFIDR